MAYVRIFGDVPGSPEGTVFENREQVRLAGLHAHKQSGISGTTAEGADAIVLNGGYPDDIDSGDEIIYTGHGGQGPGKNQIAHQDLTDVGNAALVRSLEANLPVRVIRGAKDPSPYAPSTGYRYDGLYRVVDFWFKKRSDGYRVLQFRMLKVGDTRDLEAMLGALALEGEPPTPDGPVSRRQAIVEQLNRRARIVRQVKSWHENRCQFCGESIELAAGPSSEVAHIRGLGRPHNGPDVESNALCLCPNDHLRFDHGARYLTDRLEVVDALRGEVIGKLRQHPQHIIDLEYVRYHRVSAAGRE